MTTRPPPACATSAPPPRQHDPLTLAELEDLFGQLAGVGAMRLGLTGGEPLLRPDLLDVLDLALAAGLHPCLTTNGFFLTDTMARALGQRQLVWLNVSLDGATAATNDAGFPDRAVLRPRPLQVAWRARLPRLHPLGRCRVQHPHTRKGIGRLTAATRSP